MGCDVFSIAIVTELSVACAFLDPIRALRSGTMRFAVKQQRPTILSTQRN